MNTRDCAVPHDMQPLVLVVDDETRSLDAIRRNLEEEFRMLTATSADEARGLLERHEVSVILCDQRMPGTSGVKFLKEVRELWPDTVRIIISGYTDSQDIIAGINDAGIYQYLLKPWVPEHLLSTVARAAEARSLQMQTQRLNLELRTSTPVLRQRSSASLASARAAFDFDRLVRAPGSPLDAVCEVAARVARYDLAVLVTGESGTGKELLARAIHYASPRAERAFVLENCAAMSDTLLESELFGHKRGSFTGAFEDHVGLFQRADGGTIFLDEIGDTSAAFQVKLLRVLQEGEVRPVGASRSIVVNVRVIAATHRDLEQDVRSGRFRQHDLVGAALARAQRRCAADCRHAAGAGRPGTGPSGAALCARGTWQPAGLPLARQYSGAQERNLPRRGAVGRIHGVGGCVLAPSAPWATRCQRGCAAWECPATERQLAGTSGCHRGSHPARNTAAPLLEQDPRSQGAGPLAGGAAPEAWPLWPGGGRAMHEQPLNLLWLQSGGCGGCSMSLLCADTADFAAQLRQVGIHLLWHPSLSLESGHEMLEVMHDCLTGRTPLHVLCIEGAVLRGPEGTGRFHLLAGTQEPMMHWVRQLSAVAHQVMAVGSCAAFGGISAAGCNPTDACGLQYEGDQAGGLLGAAWRSAGGLPVVNVAGCPTHPGWVLETLAALTDGTQPLATDQLDALGRPRAYCDQLAHHGCARNEFYEYKASAEKPSDLGCLMEHMGCKGTQAHADCNIRLWNGEGSCARGGYACISCTEPGFEEPGHPFHQTPKVAGIPIGLPTDMHKAWFVALASQSKSATPRRVKQNSTADHVVVAPMIRKTRLK